MQQQSSPRRFGIVGGLGALGAADVFFKLVQALPASTGSRQPELTFEQRPFHEDDVPGEASASQNGRKLYVFDMIRRFEARGVDAVLLPCFISHTFLGELKAEVRLPIIDLMAALREHVAERHSDVRRLGVLTSDHCRAKRLFERHFPAERWELLYPRPQLQRDGVMAAIYGPNGIKAGHLGGDAVERLADACRDLIGQGAELILPGFAEIPIVLDALQALDLPVLDANRIHGQYAVAQTAGAETRPLKVGVVGGVGPAATADFLAKIVRNTDAQRDQEHVKLVVEQNPQIPDRTEHLLGSGVDPTIALYSTCKKLEAAGADLIAIPCNTAHAFVERIQPYLSIAVVNMLHETVDYISKHHPECSRVGLLATGGTVASGVYAEAMARAGLQLILPDDEHQARVMRAIYGPKGVKAGCTAGECVDDLNAALASVVERGAQVVVLGCTELPLLLARNDAFRVAGRTVALLDPTDILARRCARLGARTCFRIGDRRAAHCATQHDDTLG